MTCTSLKILSLSAAAFCLIAGPAAAQMMGNGPYSFPARSNSFAAQAQITQKLNSNGGLSSGMEALSQYVYNSSSTAIGNYNNVTVGDNSTAKVVSQQDSTGSQTADAETDIKSTTFNHSSQANSHPAP
ncbi:MAG: hypothetical protein ACK4NA_00375 [Alphaproteobacteria bacterium]